MTTDELLHKYPVINNDWKSKWYTELATTICDLFTQSGFDIPGEWMYDKFGYNAVSTIWFVRQQTDVEFAALNKDPWNRKIPCYDVDDKTVVTIYNRNYSSLELRSNYSYISLGRLYASSVVGRSILLLDLYATPTLKQI